MGLVTGSRRRTIRRVLPPPSVAARLRRCLLPQVKSTDYVTGREEARRRLCHLLQGRDVSDLL
jgi:hypothetical protein